MKRPLLIVSLSFLLGVLLNENIIWTTLIVVLFFICFLFEKEYKRVILLALVAMFVGNIYFRVYENFRNEEVKEYVETNACIIGTVYFIDDEDTYLIKNVQINEKSIKSNVRIKSTSLDYGDRIKGICYLKLPNKERNKGGFNYRQYLKTQNIYLTGTMENVEIIGKNRNNVLENISEKIRKKVREFTVNSINDRTSGILEALMIGDDRRIEEQINEQYEKAGMIHLLVVSGGHVAFLILLLTYILNLLNVSKLKGKYILICIIVMYMFITGLTPSVLRAGIAAIIIVFADIIGRENDTLTTIGLIALLLTLENPNIIYSLSFQLSFLGTIGIVLGYPKVKKFFDKIPKKIGEPIALTISAQLFVTPITLYNFNTLYLGGIVSNIFSMSLAGIIMMLGIILFPVYLLLPPLSNVLMKIVELLIILMNFIAKVFSSISFLNLTIPTPSIFQILIYYILILYLLDVDYTILVKLKKSNNLLPKEYISKRKIKIIKLICGIVSILIISCVKNTIPKGVEIAMLDVGHGDSILITTPHRKLILIDTGDSYSNNGKIYDSGEQTVVPYILDNGYKKVDLLILSHLDSDHIGGLNSVIKSLDVKNVGISINSKLKDEFNKVDKIIKNEKAKKLYLSKGKSFYIDGVKFEILSPSEKDSITTENNDSIVILMTYQGKKVLFMGDLEAEAEKELVENYINLDVDILKVGHHGSITSTTEELVEKTTPLVSLISVGNRFKSIPSSKVLNRLGSVYSKVYRTDKMGEIKVIIKNSKIYVNTIY